LLEFDKNELLMLWLLVGYVENRRPYKYSVVREREEKNHGVFQREA